jgi:hypothetical protein
MNNDGWVVVIFEAEPPREIAFVKGPFDKYEEAAHWAEKAKYCADVPWQITFIDNQGEEEDDDGEDRD